MSTPNGFTEQGSEYFSLAKSDMVKIGKGAAITAVAAVLTYLIEVVFPGLEKQPGANLGLLVMLATIINGVRKYITDTTQTVFLWLLITAFTNSSAGGV